MITHINSIHHFRAISIVLIIAGHCIYSTGLKLDSLAEYSVANLVLGATSFFVFISGFLFHQVFYPKFRYKKFMLKKAGYVFLPYLILGMLPIYYHLSQNSNWFSGYFLPDGNGMVNEYLIPITKYYVSGRFVNAYWYIPFILAVFALSPLHIKYISLNFKTQLSLIVVFSMISIFLHRPVSNLIVWQSVLYFTPIYLIGISASMHREYIYQLLRGREWYLLGLAVLFAAYQAKLGHLSNYHKSPFHYAGIDLMYFQKVMLCLFFMCVLNRYETFNSKLIDIIATTSFAAFFIHPLILFYAPRLGIRFMQFDSWLYFVFFVAALTAVCLILSMFFKKVFSKHSKFVFGY